MKEDPYGTASMFDATPLIVPGGGKEKPIVSVAQGNCPRCMKAKIGLVPCNDHLQWRMHTYKTWSGATLPCPAVGIYVCQLPEAEPFHTYLTPVRCRHDRTLGNVKGPSGQ